MTEITVNQEAGGTFRVQTPAGTSHEVSVPAGFAASLGLGDVAPEELVRTSFEFLLEREPATSILRTFSLDVISQYFPGYPAEIGTRLEGGRSGRLDPPLATGGQTAVSLIPSLIHVHIPTSITVHYRTLSRLNTPS